MKFFIFLFLLISRFGYAEECENLVIVRIDKSFTKEQKNLIEKASISWYKTSNKRICFYIIEADLSKVEDYRYDNMTTIYSGNFKWHIRVANNHGCVYKLDKCLAITTPSGTRRPRHDIFLVKKKNFFSLITHELGHVLGLGHSKNPCDLMYEDIRNYIFEPSKGDERALKYILNSGRFRAWHN